RIALVGEIAKHSTHTQPVTGIAVIPGSNPLTILSVSQDRTLTVWEPSGGAEPRFVSLPYAARSLAVSPDGTEVATAGGNRFPPAELIIHRWDPQRLVFQHESFEGHSRMINALKYSPDGQTLASAGADGVFLWSLNSTEPQLPDSAECDGVLALAYSSDGTQLLAGGVDGSIWFGNIAAGRQMKRVSGSSAAVRAAARLTGGFVTAGDDAVIRIWNTNAEPTREFKGGDQAILSLTVSPDERQLLTGTSDGAIDVWDVETGVRSCTLRGHVGAVNGLACVDSGRQAVSGGADNTVRLWQLPFPGAGEN
ncbi:MAG: WD40 repeat domain-containing protein, partial [Planctomycetaceae bacterium]|nr:WD40 repeat domain-containing protein [Planctomycetaceae bacterium]